MSDPNRPPFDPNQPPPAAFPPPAGSPPPYASMSTGGYPAPYNGPPPDGDSRTMAMLAHLLGILLGFLGPLIIWLVKKDKPFVDDQGKEALNFQLTAIIGWIVCVMLACFTLGILFFLPFVWWVVLLVFSIIACIESNKGNAYRYPINIRFVK